MSDQRGLYHMGRVDLDALAWADKDSTRLDIVMDAFIPFNPNIEAVFQAIKKHLAPLAPSVLDVAWHDAAVELAAAALTPGDEQ